MKVIKQSAHIVTDWPKMNLCERCEFAGRISHASEDKIKEGSAEEFVRRMVKLGHESVFEFARIKSCLSPEIGTYNYKENLRTIREQCKKYLEHKNSNYLKGYLHALSLSRLYPAFFSDIESDYFRDDDHGVIYERDDEWIPVLITTNRAISHQLVRYRKDVVYLQQSQRYVKYDDIEFIDPEVYFDESNPDKMWGIWEDEMYRAAKYYEYCLTQGYSAQAARLFLPNSTATKLIMYASPDTWRHVFEQRISDKADPMIRELLEPLKEEFVKEELL